MSVARPASVVAISTSLKGAYSVRQRSGAYSVRQRMASWRPLHTAAYAQDECRRAQRARLAHLRATALTATAHLPYHGAQSYFDCAFFMCDSFGEYRCGNGSYAKISSRTDLRTAPLYF
jgi:hypothetical protein